MLTFYLPNTNIYTIRIEPTGSSDDSLLISLQDMTLLTNTYYVLNNNQFIYEPYESILTFDLNLGTITNVTTGSEYRASIDSFNSNIGTGSLNRIWYGSAQVYSNQTINKEEYVTQIDQFISKPSTNEYIIMT
jgi:hypothetical protein